jgi:hypothetical protein
MARLYIRETVQIQMLFRVVTVTRKFQQVTHKAEMATPMSMTGLTTRAG